MLGLIKANLDRPKLVDPLYQVLTSLAQHVSRAAAAAAAGGCGGDAAAAAAAAAADAATAAAAAAAAAASASAAAAAALPCVCVSLLFVTETAPLLAVAEGQHTPRTAEMMQPRLIHPRVISLVVSPKGGIKSLARSPLEDAR